MSLLALLALLALWPDGAQAQDAGEAAAPAASSPAMANVNAAEAADAQEPGAFSLGPMLLRPLVFTNAMYNTNVFLQSEDELLAGESLTDAWLIVPGAELRLETRSPERHDVRATAKLFGELYTSSNDAVSSQSGVETDLGISWGIYPQAVFTSRLHVNYARTNSPQYDVSEQSFNENVIHPGIEFSFQPSGGRVFKQTLSYDYKFYLLEQIESLNRHIHELLSTTRWNILPRTGVVLNVSWTPIRYVQPTREIQDREADTIPFALSNVDSDAVRATLGISGLFLERFALSAMVGYGYTFYEAGENAHVVLGRASATYRWRDGAELKAGYDHNFADSSFGNFYTFHRGYLSYKRTFINRLGAFLQVAVTGRDFAAIADLEPRDEIMTELQSSLDYEFIDGLRLGANYQLRWNETDFSLNLTGADGNLYTLRAGYIQHLVFLSASYDFSAL